MREVEVSTFVPESPEVVERELTPEAVIEYEGSFEVQSVAETDDGWTVTAGGRGLTMHLDFETGPNRLSYRQRGSSGPFESMETTIAFEPENEGTQVTATSAVSLGLPVGSLTDRIAAWKRRGELRRALDGLATEL